MTSQPLQRPVYSVSSLVIYEACPLQYYDVFVRGIPPPRTPAMARGTSLHKLIADHLRRKPVALPEDDPRVVELFGRFEHSRFNLSPVAIEKPFRMALENGDVRGRIDLVLPGAEGGVELVDFKSGSSRPRAELERHLQLPLYALAAGKLYGVESDQLRYTYYFVGDATEVTFKPSPTQLAATAERAEGIMHAIQSGKFEPKPGCGCFACERAARWSGWR